MVRSTDVAGIDFSDRTDGVLAVVRHASPPYLGAYDAMKKTSTLHFSQSCATMETLFPMEKRIDGTNIAHSLEQDLALRVKKLTQHHVNPTLVVYFVGNDERSKSYITKKAEAAERVGITFILRQFPEQVTTETLCAEIIKDNTDQSIHAIIVQLPLPAHIEKEKVLNTVTPEKDADCLTDNNLGKLVNETHTMIPPTPGAVLAILEYLQVDVAGKNITLVGTGQLVGKPLSIALIHTKASVTTCNEHTVDVVEKCRAADIIVTGVGKPNLITKDMVKPGAIVIDTGVSFVNGKITGDVAYDDVSTVASAVTPTPGGVGPLTVIKLLENVIVCAETLLTHR